MLNWAADLGMKIKIFIHYVSLSYCIILMHFRFIFHPRTARGVPVTQSPASLSHLISAPLRRCRPAFSIFCNLEKGVSVCRQAVLPPNI